MIDASKIEEFSLAAQHYYSDRLPYHNWSHAVAVMEEVDKLSERLSRRTRRLARGALHIAAAWHDAGFHEDHTKLGFETKEHYSAALAEHYLKAQGADDSTRKVVRVAILGTIHSAERPSINAVILHRADVANIGDTYKNFLAANIKLWHEHSLLNGTPVSWADHQRSSARFVEFSAQESLRELPRLGEPIGQPDSYDTNARRNAQLLLQEPQPKQ